VQVDVDLRSGNESATAWGCDLSKRYVEINTEYN
jgi:glutamate N-acetyltransferase/amino-acid N-acetyltransferase